jgi:hypothetical protein
MVLPVFHLFSCVRELQYFPFYTLFFLWRTRTALSIMSSAIFLYVVHFPPVIVISPVSETIILWLRDTSLVLFPGSLALLILARHKQKGHRLAWVFLLRILSCF